MPQLYNYLELDPDISYHLHLCFKNVIIIIVNRDCWQWKSRRLLAWSRTWISENLRNNCVAFNTEASSSFL